MSHHYPLSPVQQYCPSCNGFGRVYGDYAGSALCSQCDGIGRVFIEGGPSFGCKLKLSSRKPGEIVTLGNGDRGRVIRHVKRGTPTTEIALIDPEDLFETEDTNTTTYPSETGVASVSPTSWLQDQHGGAKGDPLDPLQKKAL